MGENDKNSYGKRLGNTKGPEAHIEELIGNYLDEKVKLPIFYTVTHDPVASLRWSNSFVILRLSEKLIVDYDVELEMKRKHQSTQECQEKEDIEKKRLYLGYLGKVLTSSLISLGTTDYIGSLILVRSVLELLIGIATDTTGGMKKRIWAIDFLSETEKSKVYELWNELNAWAHPYGKWRTEVCPRFYGCGDNFSPSLFDTCLSYLDKVLDLMLTITVERFRVKPTTYVSHYRQISKGVSFLEISDFKMFRGRLAKL